MSLGWESNPGPISAKLLKLYAIRPDCRPKPSIIDWPKRKNRDRSPSAAPDALTQRTQDRPHIRSLGRVCSTTQLRPHRTCALFVGLTYRLRTLLRYTQTYAIADVSNNRRRGSGDLLCVSARRMVRPLGSHDANRERYRVHLGHSCVVHRSGVFVCAIHFQIRTTRFCCKECLRFLCPKIFPFRRLQFPFAAF